jgi:prepilin-type processing-associated H-X9-DG protein/prepilin-type N-terminal cleavage/methylation domain-containing protein
MVWTFPFPVGRESFLPCDFVPRRAARSGFTLVELLVVIGIISLLISMLLPALNKARQAANTVACLSNERQIGQAFFMYASENKGCLPNAFDYADRGVWGWWYSAILPYLGTQLHASPAKKTHVGAYLCPTHQASRGPEVGPIPGSKAGPDLLDYGINYGGGGGVFGWNNYSGYPSSSAKIAEIGHPSSIFMLMDARVISKLGTIRSGAQVAEPFKPSRRSSGAWAFNADTDGDGINDTSSGWSSGNGDIPVPNNGADFRHNGRVNVLFVDGHAATLSVKEWVLPEHWVW